MKSPYFEKEFKQAADAGVISKDNDFAGSWSGISDHGEATNLNLVHQLKCNVLDPLELEQILSRVEREILFKLVLFGLI